jgi:para-nitrobenzyl esterase
MSHLVETRAGTVEGFQEADLIHFRGIPYAQSPVGELRYRAPQPVTPWSGVRDATGYGPSAPQRDLPITVFAGWEVGPQDEDCLYLNVTTPAVDDHMRPVLVWIHGGGFMLGSGSQAMYDPERLVKRDDVVVVRINYRLGPLGFLHLGDLLSRDYETCSNAGIEDQIAALRWVAENIEAFGGDSQNVTIFGESAGGMSVGTLLGTPRAVGLFQRAIPQSGAAHNVHSKDVASEIAERFLGAVEGSGDAWDRLSGASTEQLLAAHAAVLMQTAAEGRVLMPFQPVVDGRTLPRAPLQAIASGLSSEVPVLIGTSCEMAQVGNPTGATGKMKDEVPKRTDTDDFTDHEGESLRRRGGGCIVDVGAGPDAGACSRVLDQPGGSHSTAAASE